jgi:hypothetical protein
LWPVVPERRPQREFWACSVALALERAGCSASYPRTELCGHHFIVGAGGLEAERFEPRFDQLRKGVAMGLDREKGKRPGSIGPSYSVPIRRDHAFPLDGMQPKEPMAITP